MANITNQSLRHARTHKRTCNCYKSEFRDSECAKDWPELCPWWALQLHRHITGDFSNRDWWLWQLNMG